MVRPLRTKHCRICDRCVAQFDHHCPYIYNCVGLRNRGWFLTFTLSVAVNCTITIFFAFYCISLEGWKLLYVIGLVEALIFCGLGWLLSGFTVLNITIAKHNVISHNILFPAVVCRHEPDDERDVQLQALQLPEELSRQVPQPLLQGTLPQPGRVLPLRRSHRGARRDQPQSWRRRHHLITNNFISLKTKIRSLSQKKSFIHTFGGKVCNGVLHKVVATVLTFATLYKFTVTFFLITP